jgi:DNA repair protein RecO (recombination protein O)
MPGPPVLDTAIVVGSLAYGESDRIVRLLLPTRGRVSALARGARGSRRRFQGAIDLGNRMDVEVRKGRGDLWSLTGVTLVDARLHVREDHVRLALLAYLCEVAGALAAEEHAEPTLFGLLDTALTVLDHATAMPTAAFRLGFEAKALTFAGFAPALQICVACERPLEGALLLRPDGAATHADCPGSGLAVSAAWVADVELCRRTPLRELVDRELPSGPAWALSHAIEAHTERGLKSRSFLQQSEGPSVAPAGTAP